MILLPSRFASVGAIVPQLPSAMVCKSILFFPKICLSLSLLQYTLFVVFALSIDAS